MSLKTLNTYLRYLNLVLVIGMDPDPNSNEDSKIWIETASGYDRRTRIETISGRKRPARKSGKTAHNQ